MYKYLVLAALALPIAASAQETHITVGCDTAVAIDTFINKYDEVPFIQSTKFLIRDRNNNNVEGMFFLVVNPETESFTVLFLKDAETVCVMGVGTGLEAPAAKESKKDRLAS